ncbi:hypothetical protein BCY90_15605 [Agrobacterium deltaense]|uniref:hypothetical protein n=1 Tax=Agrobacterium TaxID=357 RepID=UPI000745A4DD|nr:MULTISPECIES: hypothetical protein [Agrobacterium]KVK54332.1 hypothetical protein L901_18345 [Agrobacterium sp. D14]RKF41746.1 hypothetical protein BCY90_15605 [Agrobacterium deltaense]
MKVLIRGWKTRNLRGGLRHLDIDLGEAPNRWSLIQMPNGMGKTTTMSLLRKLLSNDAIGPAEVLDLRADDQVEEGSFELQLIVDDRPFRLGIDFDFRTGNTSRYTVRAESRDGGRVPGRALPTELSDLLTTQLAEMFIFNGELAKQIRDMNGQTADNAIKSLYRLGQIASLKASVTQIVEVEQLRAAAMTTAKEDRGVNRLKNSRDEALRANTRLTSEERTLATQRSAARKRAEELEAAIKEHLAENDDYRDRLTALTAQQEALTQDTHFLSGQALALLRRPPHVHPRLLARLTNLGGRLFELKLPETISSEFFQDLAKQERCVCGRPLGHDEKEHIRTESSRYLAQDQISIINQMKLALRETDADTNRFASTIEELRTKLLSRQRLKANRDRLEMESIENGDAILADLHKQRDDVIERLSRLDHQYERLTTKDSGRQRELRLTWETNLSLCKAELKDRDNKYNTALNTRRFNQKADVMKALITDFETRSLTRLRERVRRLTNEKLLQIARTELLEVTRIAGGLAMASPGLHEKKELSEGQSLSVAYAFLTSLLSDAPYSLPFVVDSPVVSLDNSNRREVGDLIPGLFDQMIMFVISSERDGFAESFYRRGNDVRYLTISRLEGQVRIEEGITAFQSFQGRDAVQ